MKRYRKKPVEIEAVQWKGTNASEVFAFAKGKVKRAGLALSIQTLEGLMFASLGDYIIKGVKGEFYPCKPDIFEETYELC